MSPLSLHLFHFKHCDCACHFYRICRPLSKSVNILSCLLLYGTLQSSHVLCSLLSQMAFTDGFNHFCSAAACEYPLWKSLIDISIIINTRGAVLPALPAYNLLTVVGWIVIFHQNYLTPIAWTTGPWLVAAPLRDFYNIFRGDFPLHFIQGWVLSYCVWVYG